jgi:TctA family transporter
VNRFPLDYLTQQFRPEVFHDLFWPLVIASLVFLVGQVVLYNVRSRQLRRFEPLVNMQEWFLWTGLITFGLVLVEALFVWDFFTVLLTLALGCAAYLWIRFRYFPPQIEAYNQQLRRARFFSQARFKHPEATIRSRRQKRRRR